MKNENSSNLIALNNKGLKIKTSSGFVPFAGISPMGKKQLYNITFDDGSNIKATSTHRFFTPDFREIHTRELSIGIELLGTPNRTVVSIDKDTIEETFDIIESETKTYLSNGILSHNCIFLSSDALLIDSMFLANLSGEMRDIQPIKTIHDVVFFKEIIAGGTYLVGVDPATGSGEDYSTITVFDFPNLDQVAEYRSNTMSTNGLYGILKNVLLYINQTAGQVYFSTENNGVGEGIIALYEADENPPEDCEFVSEPGKNKTGMRTTNRVKLKACINFKEMLEKRNIHIKSKVLLAELKSFVRSKGSYEAQRGSTDDCISAVLIIMRILEEISSYDQEVFDRLYSGEFEKWAQGDYDGYDGAIDENDEGLPIVL